ncbi:hypothetical protein H4R33_002549 [Dimargaris cristalligena]|nr:hypothetical protein H4R33_002549 [Dimargaris cristalligena]
MSHALTQKLLESVKPNNIVASIRKPKQTVVDPKTPEEFHQLQRARRLAVRQRRSEYKLKKKAKQETNPTFVDPNTTVFTEQNMADKERRTNHNKNLMYYKVRQKPTPQEINIRKKVLAKLANYK